MKNVMMVIAGALILLGYSLNSYAQNSVLSEGSWFKISVTETGVHKITFDDLVSYGIDPTSINPQNIRLYGNGNGMLPESNDAFVYQDLIENAISVVGEEDGSFDTEDYILFYGEGPTAWKMDPETGLFKHETNLYTTHTCYFLNFDLGEGKRIEQQASLSLQENGFSGSFDDYYVHELELISLIHSGKDWYGEEFKEILTYGYQVEFPDLIQDAPLNINAAVAARSGNPSTITMLINDNPALQFDIPAVNYLASSDFAKVKMASNTLYNLDEILYIQITFQQAIDSAIAWLDYFEINARRHTIFDAGQMSFRDKLNSMPGDIIKFKVYTENENVTIWNVTDPMNINLQEYEIEQDGIFYKTVVEGIEEFIVFDNSAYLSVTFLGEIENQNLHATEPVDLIIITHEDFINHAEELAQLHQDVQDITVEVVDVDKIYNEFSSGVQDVTAIRDFINYIYELKPLLGHVNVMLVGNTSYDYLDRVENNTNFIPTWQSPESLNRIASYCTDDYLGIFDDVNQNLDIGIGRLPLNNIEEANILVEKITQYCTSQNTMGDWRNRMCFIADDEDGNLHLNQIEDLVETVKLYNSSINNQKIYLDAFEQIEIPEGPRYPEVNQQITNVINEGVSVINFTGHGNYMSWAFEQVFIEDDITSWENQNQFPLILAATADFGRIDDPEINSLSLQSLMKENAGSIAVYAANRATYAGSNFAMQKEFYEMLLSNPDYTLGEVIKESKNLSGGSPNTRKFWLLGDPAIRLALPFNKVITKTINDIQVEEFMDTIHPGEQITITGIVTDEDENPLTDFQGNMLVKIYDVVSINTTFGNDPQSNIVDFETQELVIHELEAEIANGQFDFSFNYPNISYEEFGNFKLSYYANDELVDAAGYYTGITVGGLAGIGKQKMVNNDFIHFYPTVVNDKLNYKFITDITDLEIGIYNLQGICVKKISVSDNTNSGEGSFNVSELKSGMYMVKAVSSNSVQSIKILKQ
jgi:hypothetical protein